MEFDREGIKKAEERERSRKQRQKQKERDFRENMEYMVLPMQYIPGDAYRDIKIYSIQIHIFCHCCLFIGGNVVQERELLFCG